VKPTKNTIFYTAKAIILYYPNKINSGTWYLVRRKWKEEEGRSFFIPFLFDSIIRKREGSKIYWTIYKRGDLKHFKCIKKIVLFIF